MGYPAGNTKPNGPIKIQLVLWGNPEIPGDSGVYYPTADSIKHYNWDSNRGGATDLKTRYSVNGNKVMDIFMLGRQDDWGAWGGEAYRNKHHNHLSLTNAWSEYHNLRPDSVFAYAPTAGFDVYHFGRVLNHEVAHLLGLEHTLQHVNGTYECVSDVFETYTPAPPGANNVMSYNNCFCAWTPCQLASAHHYLNMMKPQYTDFCNRDPNGTFTINQNQNITWTTPRAMRGDLVVEGGATLTIKCNLSMAKDAIIIVKPGGRLIVDAGRITNECHEYWGGIQVWGNSSQNQYPVGNPTHQGYVELKNGAYIAFARNAISTYNPAAGITSAGGVVVVNNATFQNCRRSIEFMKYQNRNSVGAPIKDFSSITKAVFSNRNAVDSKTHILKELNAHVTLWDVKGIRFTDCFFEDFRPRPYDAGSRGIRSLDAGYTVTKSSQSLNATHGRFYYLHAGIEAMGSGGSATNIPSIDRADFHRNNYGFIVSAVDYARVTRSQFKFGTNPASNAPDPYRTGLYIFNSTGFRIEENGFTQLGSVPSVGIKISDSGPYENRTYRNTFTGLHRGQWAERVNRSGNLAGLQFRCNTNSGSQEQDIYIEQATDPDHGVRSYQGSSILPADLQFSQGITPTSANPYRHIWNRSANAMRYYHLGGVGEPQWYNPDKVYPQYITHDIGITCPSNFGSGGSGELPQSGAVRGQLAADYDAAETAYLNLLYNYHQLIDGGSTNQLLQQIMTTWSQDAWQMRGELLAQSPYLSEEALRTAAESDVMPHAMLLEVCLANPEATGSEAFIGFLENDIPSPMPGYMLDMIVANRGAETPRGVLESGLAEQSANMADACDWLLLGLKTDSLVQMSQIRYWHNRRGTIADSYAVAESYLEEGDLGMAESLLNGLPQLHALSDNEALEHLNYLDLFALRKNAADNNRTIMQLDSMEVAALQQLYQNQTGRSSVMARNILCFGYDICPDYPTTADSVSTSSRTPNYTNPRQVLAEAYNKLAAYPNPAREYSTISWELPLLKGEAMLVLTDLTGRELKRQAITSKQGQLALDTRNLKSGIYLLQVIQNSEQLTSSKIAVVK